MKAFQGTSTPFAKTLLFLTLLFPGVSKVNAQTVPGENAPRESLVRVKDLARIQGVRSNQLVGFGLVVGLAGSGDSKASLSTNKAVSHLLSRLGSQVTPDQVTTKNVASVIVTADLPPFAKVGDRLSVRVSSVGDASSLAGGSLIMTPLKAADSEIYAVAQGHLSLGVALAGASGSSTSSESAVKTIALSEGGVVEKEYPSRFLHGGKIHLSLLRPDFTTASRLAQALNRFYGEFAAKAENAGRVSVTVPPDIFQNPSFQLVDFVASLEQVRVSPDSRARVVINERTGTIIAGSNVQIKPVAISHGHLEIRIDEKSQRMNSLGGTTTIGELVKSVNALGAGPKDLVSIIQALSAAGALNAELVFL